MVVVVVVVAVVVVVVVAVVVAGIAEAFIVIPVLDFSGCVP